MFLNKTNKCLIIEHFMRHEANSAEGDAEIEFPGTGLSRRVFIQ